MAPLEAGYDETADDSRDSVHDSKWLKLFPNCVADKDRSSMFMTRAIYVAFSMILHRRNILGPEYFASNYITEKLKIRSLSFQHEEALLISQMLRSAGNAVKLGYLDELALVITKHEGDAEAIEVFSFKMHYFEDGGVAAQLSTDQGDRLTPLENLAKWNYQNTGTVRDQLILLARSVHVICQKVLGKLPEEHSANFRVKYTTDTPKGFRIEGFYDSSTFYTEHPEMQTAVLGQLRPGYHGSIIDCTSIFMDDAYAAESALKKYVDKAAEEIGYRVHNTLYGSFLSESDSTGHFSRPIEETAPLRAVHESSTPSEILAKHLSEVNLESSVMSPETSKNRKSPSHQSERPKRAPYGKGRSRK